MGASRTGSFLLLLRYQTPPPLSLSPLSLPPSFPPSLPLSLRYALTVSLIFSTGIFLCSQESEGRIWEPCQNAARDVQDKFHFSHGFCGGTRAHVSTTVNTIKLHKAENQPRAALQLLFPRRFELLRVALFKHRGQRHAQLTNGPHN